MNPPGEGFHARSSRWGGMKNRSGIIAPPIYLATAAGLLIQNGVETKLVDAVATGITRDELDNLFAKQKNSLVVIETSTASIKQDALTAEFLKNLYGCTIVFVGAHVSALPGETLEEFPQVDFVCIGEYEFTLLELCRAIGVSGSFSGIKGLAFRIDSKVTVNQKRELIDLDLLPFPAYEQLPISNYNDPITRNRPYMAIVSSRGCPFKCKFCVAPQVLYDYKVRYRNPKRVVDEIELLTNSFGVKEIFFDDATFTLNKKHLFTICSEMKSRNIRIDWSCFGRSDCVDEEVLDAMKNAGCYMVRYGLETLDDRILNEMGKGLTVENIKKSIELTKKKGLRIHLTVMLGYPGETRETVRKTIDFVRNTGVDYAQFSIAIPYPGTAFYKEMKEQNRLLSNDWTEYDGTCKTVVKSDDLSAEELTQAVEKAYREFYFRPSYLFKRLVSIGTFTEFRCAVNSAYNLLRSQL